ncbi:rhomboid-domain-containing [Pyrrhoderma noxium]|uniref:Rhomboid-domain-containing n=1 Tax=Pyrrhoderma noxium TaxID=2282107 RepID=A0A286UM59_9AGAM|nr:rhomboid-domain-containing [Pyrrhoderma noxium]
MAYPSTASAFRSWVLNSSRFYTHNQPGKRLFTTSLFLRNGNETLSSHSYFFTTARSSQFTSQTPLRANLQFISEQLLKFRQSGSAWSRVGWYRDSKGEALKRAVRNTSGRGPQWNNRGPTSNLFDRFRIWFDQFPEGYLIWTILGINGTIFLGWQYAIDRYRHGDASLLMSMMDNVTLSWKNIREGRFWTIITSAFSHNTSAHILMNCLSFYFVSPPILQLLGNTSFMGLYLFGGLACSFVSLFFHKGMSQRGGAADGASGAIMAVMSFFACVSPQTKFLLFFVVPVPAWALVSGFFLWDGYTTLTDANTKINGAGHVGGMLAGGIYYLLKRRFIF